MDVILSNNTFDDSVDHYDMIIWQAFGFDSFLVFLFDASKCSSVKNAPNSISGKSNKFMQRHVFLVGILSSIIENCEDFNGSIFNCIMNEIVSQTTFSAIEFG